MPGPVTERAERYVRSVFKTKKGAGNIKKEEMVKRADKLMETRKQIMKRYKGN